MVIDPSKDMAALGLGGVVLELSVGHSVQRPGPLARFLSIFAAARLRQVGVRPH